MLGTTNIHFDSVFENKNNTSADRTAQSLFAAEIRQAHWRRFLARLMGHSTRLLDLNDIRPQDKNHAGSYLGARTVKIDRIRGSEGRSHDFDSDFRPLRETTRSRWMHIAIARLTGETLPPVELVKVGDFYFVRDGHHRISVARALGQQFVDAIVVKG